MSKKYSNAQKLAYYKGLAKKAAYTGHGAYRRRPSRPSYSGRGAYRRRPYYRGHGAYKAPHEDSINEIGRRIGTNIGSGLGELGAEVVKFFTGRGAYEVKSNSLLHEGNPDMLPIQNRVHKPGSVIIRKSEYIGDIISANNANTFQNTTYNINPGLANTFEWLSQVAVNFEEYEFCGMYFEYRTMSADALNSTNTALGQVIMAVDYNASNPAFVSKQQMENYEGAVSIKPSQSVRFFVECAKSLNVLTDLYVRGSAVPSGDDIRMYDLGVLNVATNGLQGTDVNLGELWVCYEVCLWKSKLYSALGFNIPWAGYTAGTSWSSSNPTGGFTFDTNSTLAVSLASNVLSFPETSLPQTYFVYIQWFGTVAGTIAFPGLTVVNATIDKQSTPTPGDSARGATISLVFTTQGNNIPTLTFGTAGTLPTGASGGGLWITQISNNFDASTFD